LSRSNDVTSDGHARKREGEDGGEVPGGVECRDEVGGRLVRVDSLKFDGRLHRSWPARLVRQTGALVVIEGVFETEVRHALLGTIHAGTLSTEFYWTDRWYSVFRFREPSGALRNYYCNVNRPAEFDDGVLSFVDLDIDVLVAPDFSYTVLDEDEFETHAARFGYDESLRARVRDSLAELLRLIETRAFPFDEL
jgi:protein associated with RNAse G/E